MSTGFRASAPVTSVPQTGPSLGPLSQFPGTWVGEGFNLISLPDHQHGNPFRVMLSATRETLTFSPIGGQIPNRGSDQDDIFYLGLHYLQLVNDAENLGSLHLEPGLWLNVPATSAPDAPPSVVRQGTIPHGDSFVAQGSFFSVVSPEFEVLDSTPRDVTTGKPLTDSDYLKPLLTAMLPDGIPSGAIANPNLVLSTAINNQQAKHLQITNTQVLSVSTAPNGGIVNIPFITTNANAVKLDAIFWIETVQGADGTTFLQLQYSQTVLLRFLNIDWPHISVATLVKR